MQAPINFRRFWRRCRLFLLLAFPKSMSEKTFKAPHPGSTEMPRWDTGELIDAPRFTWKNWFALIGPGLVLGGASIGGGEWLLGPRVTAGPRRMAQQVLRSGKRSVTDLVAALPPAERAAAETAVDRKSVV